MLFLVEGSTGFLVTNYLAGVFLRRLHNFAVDVGWLPWPILPKKRWPSVRYGAKRAITLDEHQRIIERERNAERKAFYELCWHFGGSQGDIANLVAEDIDWSNRVVGYHRQKTKAVALLYFGDEIAGQAAIRHSRHRYKCCGPH